MADSVQVDLFSPEFNATPYPTYARLRAESPVHRTVLPSGEPLWLVTRYDDVEAVFNDSRFVKDWRHAMTPEQTARFPQETEALRPFARHLLMQDPPNHTRLRALVNKAFTPRLVEGLRPRIQTIADDLLDAVTGQTEIDLIDTYAFPLPITVIAELLGVPTSDREHFRAWSDAVMALQSFSDAEAIAPQLEAFQAYLQAFFAERRAAPRDDLVSGLVQAEEAGDRLSEPELFSMVFVLLIAGHETTVNLIGNATLALLQHPEQLAKLRQDPTRIQQAVEELVRFNGPVETSTQRYASQDLELGGVTIPRGERVMVVVAAANHDERHFDAPDQLDLDRPTRPHLAFGHGIHYCLGASLARLEAQIALGTLLRRFPNLRLAVDPASLTWRFSMVIRGVAHLPVAL